MKIQKPRQTVVLYCTVLLFRGFEPGVFSLEVYKIVKNINERILIFHADLNQHPSEQCGGSRRFDADQDPTFQADVDPDPKIV